MARGAAKVMLMVMVGSSMVQEAQANEDGGIGGGRVLRRCEEAAVGVLVEKGWSATQDALRRYEEARKLGQLDDGNREVGRRA